MSAASPLAPASAIACQPDRFAALTAAVAEAAALLKRWPPCPATEQERDGALAGLSAYHAELDRSFFRVSVALELFTPDEQLGMHHDSLRPGQRILSRLVSRIHGVETRAAATRAAGPRTMAAKAAMVRRTFDTGPDGIPPADDSRDMLIWSLTTDLSGGVAGAASANQGGTP